MIIFVCECLMATLSPKGEILSITFKRCEMTTFIGKLMVFCGLNKFNGWVMVIHRKFNIVFYDGYLIIFKFKILIKPYVIRR